MKEELARIKAAKILGFNSGKHFLSKGWPILLTANLIVELQGNNEVSIALIKAAIDKEIIHKHYEETDYMASDNPRVNASDFALLLKEIGAEPSESIKAWYESTLPQTEAVGDAETGNHAGTEPSPRNNGYYERDKNAIQQVKDRPELLKMRAGAIKEELQKASNLFTSGIEDWWRDNPIFPKSKAGRTKGKKLIGNKNS